VSKWQMLFARHRQELLLGAVLAFLLVSIWAQLPGSPLVEHDETRYAEIAREMLVNGDYTVPHLNGVDWYLKPPLLFWAGATSMRVFGATPWAARLPSRLAGLGTMCVLFLWVAGESDRRRGLLAAIIAAGTPLGWGIAFYNVTDGLLTFFITSAVVVGYAAVRQSSARASASLALLAGAACGCGFLAKGLIGLVFPAAILGIWALSARRGRQYVGVAATALAAALGVVLPWLAVVAARCPDYLRVFLVSEQFQRYTTTINHREQPVYFALAVFVVALTPVLGTFGVACLGRRNGLAEGERLVVVWFAFVILFFSFSRSQLASYVAPAIPAASAFIAFRFARSVPRLGAWIAQGALTTTLVVALFVLPRTAAGLLEPQLRHLAIVTAIALLGATWLAVLLAKRDEWKAIAVTFAGCAVAYAAVVVAWPTSGVAREMAALHDAVARVQSAREVELVTYHTFLRGLPWLLQRPVPFLDPGSELVEGLKSPGGPDISLAWTEARFWQRWKHGPEVMALVLESDIAEFERRAGGVPFILARARRHLLVARFPQKVYPSQDPRTSTALYASELGGHSTPVPIASVPPLVVTSARGELQGQPIVRCAIERTELGRVYEVAAGGPVPRVVEVNLEGRLVYTEELVDAQSMPQEVVAELGRVAPGVLVLFAKRERPFDGGLDRYELLVSERGVVREVEIDASGRLTG
jgi:4-amino-4-deoxy-L-arabinose transferase-like glycosyltransferase